MSTRQPSYHDQFTDAVAAGDLDRLRELYDREKAGFGYIMNKERITPRMLETTINAARRDPDKLQRDILLQILSVQYTLLDRVETGIFDMIADADKRGHPYGEIPDKVASELLPRYARISSEIFATLKLIKKLASPAAPAGAPAPAGTPANDQADSDDDDAQAEGADGDA